MSLSLRQRIEAALEEDLSSRGDVTTRAVFPPGHRAAARVVSREDAVLCGGGPFALVFEILGDVIVQQLVADGETVVPGVEVFRLEGSVHSLLAGERTALNLLQYSSGIATQTRRFVEAAGGRLAVCDTRKTMPLWRDVAREAVRCGGGTNHRMGLYDMVMLKDTHADGAGSVAMALERVRHLKEELRIAAEARNLDEVRMALDGRADLIMLDNMSDELLVDSLKLIGGRVPVEVTGGVTVETVRKLADLGVDRVSVGALTHSVRAIDFSMRLDVAGNAAGARQAAT